MERNTLQIHDLTHGSQIRLIDKDGRTVEVWSNTPANAILAISALNRASQDAGETRRDWSVC